MKLTEKLLSVNAAHMKNIDLCIWFFSPHLTFPSHSLVPLSVPQTSGLYSQALTEVSIHSQSVQALTGQSWQTGPD